MQDYFYSLADRIAGLLRGREVYTCSFAAEDSDFARFNGGAVRQAGAVAQRELNLDLIEGRRHAAGELALAGDLRSDTARLTRLVEELRAARAELPEDPYLLYATDGRSTESIQASELPELDAMVDEVQRVGRGRDLVGIYAAGGMHFGFANSLGQRNWYGSHSYHLDWSFFGGGDKAVKASYAGFRWRADEFQSRVDAAVEQLAVLARPARSARPGKYRVYLAPAALYEIMALLGWGGFGLRAHRTKTTPLLRMIEGGARLHPGVNISENTAAGMAPDFQEAGFARPDRVALIEGGEYRDCLVAPRSAREYAVETNGAAEAEAPLSLDVGSGGIAAENVLSTLHTGIYVSNLWYANFSDRPSCRTTGMTRFATLWVENGIVQAPLDVMRFDETIYRMLGENLIGLTVERDFIIDPSTYFHRSVESARLPGALVDDFTLTL